MILSELGDTSKALAASQRAVALNEQLVRDEPNKMVHKQRLAAALNSLASTSVQAVIRTKPW